MEKLKKGDLVVYAPTNPEGEIYTFEIGKIKSINKEKKTAFVYYHTGETASCTDLKDLHKVANQGLIKTNLGGILE